MPLLMRRHGLCFRCPVGCALKVILAAVVASGPTFAWRPAVSVAPVPQRGDCAARRATSAVPEAAAPSTAGRKLGSLSIGLVAGGLGGALGLGGGFLVVPALNSLMGLEPRKSIGTSSFVVLATSASAVCTYIHEGLASLRAAGAIAVTAVISARMGASMTNKVKPKTLKKGFGAWLLLVSVVIMAKALRLLPVHSSVTHAGATAALLPLSGLGIASGLVSGLLGVGGGTVLVPVLALAFAFPQSEAQGSALLAMLLPSVVSCSTHWSKGNVDRDLAGFAVLGALLGGFGGGEMAALLPERALRLIFAAVLSVVAVKYIRS
ncbi:unnamed protein product [Cladocopium goreaui]|uniref:Membrane transporter protein n=2 Tax=Cladocopium goreaui TaxID=2562237 RepID=A0A9P1FXB9_9DINO|nr:unnamed protein product [Cladocopium goreaui]